MVTLTKEGGIGKTAIACELDEWAYERKVFPGGVFALTCELHTAPDLLVGELLNRFGVDPTEQKGNLLELLTNRLQLVLQGGPSLLLLDNLDDLAGEHVEASMRQRTRDILEAILTAVPDLRILATCRWPVGLPEHELPLEIIPMAEDEARDVFLSHLENSPHKVQVAQTWDDPESTIRQLVQMSGRHPQSLQLLARQMSRPGMTLEKLRDEAREDLLKALEDPIASDEIEDRQRKVRMSYELSYRHLSDEGKELFARMSHLPGGVWTGGLADRLLEWDQLLGPRWRELMEKELDYYALVHFEQDPEVEGHGTFEILNPMREFALEKYRPDDDQEWKGVWVNFWADKTHVARIGVAGLASAEMDISDNERPGADATAQQFAAVLLGRTETNWMEAFTYACGFVPPCARALLLNIVKYQYLTGQLSLLRMMAERAVASQRLAGCQQDLAPCLGTLGNALRDLGELDGALTALTETLSINRRLAQDDPATFDDYVATTLINIGTLRRRIGECREAVTAYREALTIYRQLDRVQCGEYKEAVALVLNNLGNALGDLGEHQIARDVLQESLATRLELAQTHGVAFRPYVGDTLNNLGTALTNLGEFPTAHETYCEALSIYRLLAQAHPVAFERNLAATLNNLGNLLIKLDDAHAARETLGEAVEIYYSLASEIPAAFARDLVMALRNYTKVTPEDDNDPWWQMWKAFQESDKDEQGEEPADGDDPDGSETPD